jgi:hypothetical protein
MNADNAYKRFQHLKTSVYGQLLTEFQIDDDLITGNFAKTIIPDEWMDEGLEPTVPPTAYNAVVNAADHILTSPRTSVPIRAVGESQEAAREIAENQQRFHNMWWARVHEDQGAPLDRGKKKLIRGKMVLKKTLKFDLLPDLAIDPKPSDKRKFRNAVKRIAKSKFLWNVDVCPPEHIFEDPSNPWEPNYVYEEYEIYTGDLCLKYPEMEKEYGTDDPMRKVQYVEMWSKPYKNDPGQYIVWVEGTVIHEAINPYSWETKESTDDMLDYDGYVPYAIVDPGYGEVDGDNKPEDRYASILRPIRSVLTSEARFLTEMEAWLRMYVFPALVTTNMEELEDGEKEFRLGPGSHLNLRPDQSVDLLKWGEAPLTLIQGLQRVNSYADEASKFGALGGSPLVGVESATESDMLLRNSATKLTGPVSGLQRACQKINSWVLMDIEHILETEVTLYGSFANTPAETTLKPSDIDSYYFTNVTFETTDETMINARKARLWADLYRIMPGLSERTAMDKMGIDDPTQEQDERSIEDLMRSPAMSNVQTLVALAGLGEVGQEVMRIMGAQDPSDPQQVMGDEQALTTVDELGNPIEPIVSEARMNAQVDQAARQFQ